MKLRKENIFYNGTVLTCKPLCISSHASLESVFKYVVNMCINTMCAILFKSSLEVNVHKQNSLLLLKLKHNIKPDYTNLDMFKGFPFFYLIVWFLSASFNYFFLNVVIYKLIDSPISSQPYLYIRRSFHRQFKSSVSKC